MVTDEMKLSFHPLGQGDGALAQLRLDLPAQGSRARGRPRRL